MLLYNLEFNLFVEGDQGYLLKFKKLHIRTVFTKRDRYQ